MYALGKLIAWIFRNPYRETKRSCIFKLPFLCLLLTVREVYEYLSFNGLHNRVVSWDWNRMLCSKLLSLSETFTVLYFSSNAGNFQMFLFKGNELCMISIRDGYGSPKVP